MSELSLAELASEHAELLPQRETLSIIVIVSSSIAITEQGDASSTASTVTTITDSFDSEVTFGGSPC